jgi:hypothetical protein
MTDLFQLLPQAVELLRGNPSAVMPLVGGVMDDFREDEFADPDRFQSCCQLMRPVVTRRVYIIRKLAGDGQLAKLAAEAAPMLNVRKSTVVALPGGAGVSRLLQNTAQSTMTALGPGLYDEFRVAGSDGREYATSRIDAIVAQNSEDAVHTGKQMLGAVMALAAIGAALSSSKLSTKLLASPVLGLLGLKAMAPTPRNTVVTTSGHEVPATSVFYDAARGLNKKAALGNMPVLLGMAAPAALGLDYLYNRHVRQNPQVRGEKLDSAGRFVTDHPLLATVGGAVAGGVLQALLEAKKG